MSTDDDDAFHIGRSRDEPEAFSEIFRRHAPALNRYVTRRLGPDTAEDVVAETFLAAFRQRDRYDPARPDARPWLFGIATNLIRRHVRTEVRQLRVLGRTGADPVTEPFTDRSDVRVSAQADGPRLAAALAAMPKGHRDALLLFAWADLSYVQIAEALDVRVGTVRSRISRARRRLRGELADLGGSRHHAIVQEEPVHD